MKKHKKISSLNTDLLFSQKYMFWSYMYFIRDFQQLLEYCFIHQEIRDTIHTLSFPWINTNKFHLNSHFSFKTCTKPYTVDNGGKKWYSLFSLSFWNFRFKKYVSSLLSKTNKSWKVLNCEFLFPQVLKIVLLLTTC